MSIPVRNTTGWVIGAQMVSAATGLAYVGTVTCLLTKDGQVPAVHGAFNGGLCTNAGNGYYVYRPTQDETDYGIIDFTFVGTGALPVTNQIPTITAAQAQLLVTVAPPLAGTVRSLIADALLELGVLEAGESMNPDQAQLGLRRVRAMIDAWAADRLTLSLQKRTPFVWPGSTSTVQVGPGQTVNMERPVWINTLTYVIPTVGTSTAIEIPVGLLNDDSFAALAIKGLVSALPTQAFYQVNRDDANGTLFVWPTIGQGLTLVLYTPQGTAVPATLDSVLQGPAGYAEAFLYQLALRLCSPLGVAVPALLPRMAAAAMETMKKPNVEPGTLSIDAALMVGTTGGYNVLSDTTSH
jgi:hypothetical protein